MKFILSSLILLALLNVIQHNAAAQTLYLHKSTVNVGYNPSFIVAADLNDDGLPDMVTADRGSLTDPREERPANDEISILFNVSKENDFAVNKMQPSLKTGFAPYAIAIANIDALKWPDILVANFMAVRDEDISLFRNLHNEGIFEAHSFAAPDKNLPYLRHQDGEGQPLFTKPGFTALAVRDLNNDGLRDVVATGWSSDTLAFFMGNAETYFIPPVYIDVPGAPRDIVTQDFNGDSLPDLAVLLYATSEIALFWGNAENVWKENARFSTRGQLPIRLQAADINGDSLPDLIATHSQSEDSVVIFYNDTQSLFSVSQEIILGDKREVLQHGLRDCAVGDFNGDGNMDIAVTCFESSMVKVLINAGKTEGALPDFKVENYPFQAARPRALCAADLNNDKKSDLAVTLWDKNVVAFLLSR